MSAPGTGSDPQGPEGADLDALRSRLAALHGNVDRLGREADTEPVEQPQQPLPPQAPEASAYPEEQTYPASPAPPVPPIAEQPPAYDPYAQPPAPPAPAEQYAYADEPVVPEVYAPAPAATNGQGEHEAGVAAVAAHVTVLDVGPFADLIELRHFEEAVSRLEVVRDVRVRRFGHGRAVVELGLGGPYSVGRELYRLGRPMRVEPGAAGELIVDFTDIPEEPAEADTEAPGAAAVVAVEGDEARSAGEGDTPERTESESV